MYLLPPWRFYPRNFVSCKAVFINFLVIYPKHGGEKFWRCVQLFRHSIGGRQTGGRTTDGHKCPINIAPLVYRYWRALKTKKKKKTILTNLGDMLRADGATCRRDWARTSARRCETSFIVLWVERSASRSERFSRRHRPLASWPPVCSLCTYTTIPASPPTLHNGRVGWRFWDNFVN